VEYGKTTTASYEHQTPPKNDVISYLANLLKRVVAFIAATPHALAQMTFYPDPSSSMDAFTMEDQFSSWSTTHDESVSHYAFSSANHMDAESTVAGGVYKIKRSYVLFDTSAIPDSATVSTSTLSLYVQVAVSTGADNVIYLVSSSPASNSSITTDDFDQLGTTSYGVTDGAYTTSAYETITLNSTGRAAISLTGITKFGLRTYNDLNNIVPMDSSEQAVDRDLLCCANGSYGTSDRRSYRPNERH
jgi:hypothetical protein